MKAKQKPGVVFQPQVGFALQRGIHKMVGAIRPTLGPLACGVAVDHINKSITLPEFLDDGGVIARRIIELPDRDEDMGAMLVRSLLIHQHERVGDGTATVAVLFEAILDAGLRYIAAGGNAMQLRKALENTIPLVQDTLDSMVVKLEGQATLTTVAESLCHERELAQFLGEAFDLLGEYGRLDIREDYGRILRRDYVEGTYYNTGLISRVFLPEHSAGKATLDNPAVFLCDFEFQDHHELFPVMQAAYNAGISHLVIIARNLSEKAVSLLVANNQMDKFKAIAVTLPGLNPEARMAALEDLSHLTGATPFFKDTGTTLENVAARDFGYARRMWADLRAFGLVTGQGDARRLRDHIRRLKTHYRKITDPFQAKQMMERIGSLLGGSMTIWVGGFTKTEIAARMALAERAAFTLRSALQEGVVPGGGMALLHCREALEKQRAAVRDDEERVAYSILIEAFAAPARTIFKNAGYDPSEVMAMLSFEPPDAGFDVVSNRVVNMCDAGILDSAMVVKATARNAISTAALALTIDSLVHLAKPEIIGKPE